MSAPTFALWSETAPLPSSALTLLEASAGTGKTYAMESLVVRYLAETDTTIEQLLLITFTRSAAADLRARVRDRLHRVLTALRAKRGQDDPLAAHLLPQRDRAELRLARALQDFDGAAISTIHSFCDQVLRRYALEAGIDPDLERASDATEVLEDAVDDLLGELYAEASLEDIDLLQAVGVKRDSLVKAAKALHEAVERRIVGEPLATPILEASQSVHAAVAPFRAWLDTAEAEAAFEAWRWLSVVDTKKKLPANAPGWCVGATKPNRWGEGSAAKLELEVREWAAHPPDLETAAKSALAFLSKAPAIGDWPGAPLSNRWTALIAQLDSIQSGILPALAAELRPRAAALLAERGLLTLDGLLTHTAAALQRPSLVQALRDHYRVALIDEFQDTDSVQWQIFHTIFSDAAHPLIAVGDPKQSIYAFRSANLGVYLGAARAANRAVLATNYRSDAPLIQALNHLWREDAFEEADVRYAPVAAKHPARIADLPPVGERPRAALELRLLPAQARPNTIADSAAAEVFALLTGGARIPDEQGRRPLRASDFAVLVYTHAQAQEVQRALHRLGIPSVLSSARSIYETEAAGWVLAWLEAVANPRDERAARALALSPLYGWTPERLALSEAPGEAQSDWEGLRGNLAALPERFNKHGFFRTFDKDMAQHGATVRLLERPFGDRAATDLGHLAEVLHRRAVTHRAGPRALADFLRERQHEENHEEQLRLETDEMAVRVTTVWSSKGLQFGIALHPFLKEPKAKTYFPLSTLETPEQGAWEPVLYMQDSGDVKEAYREMAARENTRLLYVALTRARYHVVLWCAEAEDPTKPPQDSTTKLLAPGGVSPAALTAICKDQPIGWSAALPPAVGIYAPPRAEQTHQLKVWDAHHKPGGGWMVSSFSSLSAGRGRDPDEPSARGAHDELELQDGELLSHAGGWERWPEALWEEAPGASLAAGTRTGDWLHGTFEHLDFLTQTAKDGRSLEALLRDGAARYGARTADLPAASALVARTLATPLLEAADGAPAFTLGQLRQEDRLDELQFDLGLGATLQPNATRAALDVAAQSKDFGSGAWLRALLQHLDVEGKSIFPKIRGILTGFIDLTFRTPDGRYWICDYKTNRVQGNAAFHARAGEVKLPRAAYTRPLLEAAMGHSAYPLQALLYTVALHRLLRARLKEKYSPERHLGGHVYLFVRGVEGESSPPIDGHRLGVWRDRWPTATVVGLDRALTGANSPQVIEAMRPYDEVSP